MNKRVCIISSQIAGFGKIGGFGSMTKQLANSLADRGYEVSVVVPKRKKQKRVEIVDGVKIMGVGFKDLFDLKVFRDIDADIYHSQNPNILSYLAQRAQPKKKHVITCRDPRGTKDWLVEFANATFLRRLKTIPVYIFEGSLLVSMSIRKADAVGVPATHLIQKVKNMYGIEKVHFLPNIEKIPLSLPKKNTKTREVIYVGRMDKRKRPELVFELAEKTPQVTFHIVGKAEDSDRQKYFEAWAKRLKNVNYHGFIDKHNGNKLQKMYARSHVLINTSAREGLPMTFIEASSYGCAILSSLNPDNFASKFGYFVKDDDFSKGIEYLFRENKWQKLGKKGHEYVLSIYEEKKAMEKHINLYESLFKKQAS